MIISDGRSQIERQCAPRAPVVPQSGLTFDEVRHIYRWDGHWVFSVSKVLRDSGLAPDFAGIDPAVLEKARNRGVAVHGAIDAITRGESPTIPAELTGYVAAYRAFRSESRFELVASELMVGHKEHGFAGRLDQLGWIGDQRTIADIKCVATIAHQSTAVQLGGYVGGYEYLHPTQPVHQILAVQLRPDGAYRIYPYPPAECWRIFLAALAVAQWKRTHERQ